MNISEASRQSGVSAKMIRHYESIGLLSGVDRSNAGYRQFSGREIAVLRFIRQARVLGFPMQQIDALLRLWQDPQRPSREVKKVAEEHLEEVESKLEELQQMKQTLEQLVEACRGDEHPYCPILDQLSPPDKGNA